MLYDLFMYSRNAWDVGFWTLLCIPVVCIMVAVAIIYGHRERKQKKEFEQNQKEKRDTL